jgi:hypothetical protein
MKVRVSAILTVFLLMVGVGLAQEAAYQPGKIVSIKKREVATPSGGTDAPTMASAAKYDVTVESGGKTYQAVFSAHSDLDPTWAEGKDVDVQVKGKTMYVKRSTGKQPAKLTIISSK